MTEVAQAQEDLIVRIGKADQDQQNTVAPTRKVKEDKSDAEESKKRVMERWDRK